MHGRGVRLSHLAVCLLILAHAGNSGVAEPPDGNVVYEVFVRSFADGNGDGIGDLQGLTSKLDEYLNDGRPETDHDLEVGILWLMPVFPASSYHGYDVTDFREIHPEYGDLEDFQALLAAAHERGVRVVLDVPFNHTSNDHPWFLEALANPTSPRRGFYHIEPDEGVRGGPWHSVTNDTGDKLRYLGAFSSRMPDLNFDNPKVRQEIKEIARSWLDLGVDGFRLDAAKHIYGDRLDAIHEGEILKNNDWWQEFSHFVYQHRPDAVLLGEVLGSRELLRRHAWALDGLVDEPYMEDLRHQIGWPGAGFIGRHKEWVRVARELNRTSHLPTLPFADKPFHPFLYAASHDKNPRLASALEEMRQNGMSHSVDEGYRLAMYLLLTMDDYPILYQGDEVMQRGWKWNGNPPDHRESPGDGSGIYDETLREPFPWYTSGEGPGQTRWFPPRFDGAHDGVSREEQDGEGRMLHLIRGLLNLRTQHPVLANGDLGAILTDSPDWAVFEKVEGSDAYLVLINMSGHGNSYHFHDAWYPHWRQTELIYWSDGRLKKWKNVTGEAAQIEDAVYVPPYGLVVLRARA